MTLKDIIQTAEQEAIEIKVFYNILKDNGIAPAKVAKFLIRLERLRNALLK